MALRGQDMVYVVEITGRLRDPEISYYWDDPLLNLRCIDQNYMISSLQWIN